jgi:hypothetical protein
MDLRAGRQQGNLPLEDVRNAMKKSKMSVHAAEFSFTHERTFDCPRESLRLAILYGKPVVNKMPVPASTLEAFAFTWNEENDLGKVGVRDDALALQFSLPFPFTDAEFTSWLKRVLSSIPAFEDELMLSSQPKPTESEEILDDLDKKLQAKMDERQLIGGELAAVLKVTSTR